MLEVPVVSFDSHLMPISIGCMKTDNSGTFIETLLSFWYHVLKSDASSILHEMLRLVVDSSHAQIFDFQVGVQPVL